jgi:hypothetical protein
VKCDAPKLTIIHVRDWHFIERRTFALDVRDESDETLSDEERYAVLVTNVSTDGHSGVLATQSCSGCLFFQNSSAQSSACFRTMSLIVWSSRITA